MHPPFVIYSLPRSRSFWLSRYLNYGGWTCGHDEARYIRGLDDVKSWLAQPCVGTVETAASPFWRLLPATAKVVVIRRPIAEVVASLSRTGLSFDAERLDQRLRYLDHKLDQIEKRTPGVLSVKFADLADEATCAKVFEHCLPFKHESERWARLSAMNLQTDLPALLRYQMAFTPQLDRAASICGQAIKSALWRNRKLGADDGMTFQEESLATFWRDAQRLFADHCAVVGERADEFRRKNLPLIERLSEAGALHIMTARSNGRMFGYLMTVLGPSLESADLQCAAQTIFYASSDARNLGLRLQRASVASLEARGGNWDILQRAGVRGDGARMGSLYKRMGSEDFGRLYKLSLRAA